MAATSSATLVTLLACCGTGANKKSLTLDSKSDSYSEFGSSCQVLDVNCLGRTVEAY